MNTKPRSRRHPGDWRPLTGGPNFKRPTPTTIRKPSWISLDALFVLFNDVARHLPITSVISLSNAHTRLRTKLSDHLCDSFDTLLASRISRANISSFRTLLLDTRAVISGSTALHFILRETDWQPGDFDLYAPFGTGYAIVRWLTSNEEYTIVSDGSNRFTFRPHTEGVPSGEGECDWLADLSLDEAPAAHRPSRRSRAIAYDHTDAAIYRVYKLSSTTGTFIDVIESSKPSFLPAITKFHSTLVMNYLTPESVVILYPTFTFQREGVLRLSDEEYEDDEDSLELDEYAATENRTRSPNAALERRKEYLAKYKARGFKLIPHPSVLRRPCLAACPAIERKVSTQTDEWALEVNFGKGNLAPSLDKILRSAPAEASAAMPDITVSDQVPFLTPPPRSDSSLSNLSLGVSYITNAPTNTSDSAVAGDPPNGASIPRIHILSRPPPPRTTWSLRVPYQPSKKESGGKAICTNPYCPRADGYYRASDHLPNSPILVRRNIL